MYVHSVRIELAKLILVGTDCCGYIMMSLIAV